MDILEKEIESYFVRRCASAGALAMKFNSVSASGVPDRIVFLSSGEVRLVELKAPGKKPRPLQRVMFKRFAKLGHRVLVIDSREAVDKFVDSIRGGDAV